MVDGADRINNVSQNIYVNPQDAVRVTTNSEVEPIPLVEKKPDFKFPFEVETNDDSLKFEMPENAPEHAKFFIAALSKNKKELMEELNIDSKTYDMLAQTAVAIAGTETRFGDTADRVYKAFRELYVRYERSMGSINRKPINYSRGMTNLKHTLHVTEENPQLKNQMLKFGIYDEYQLENIEKSAIGTMILLADFNKKLDQSFAEGFEQSQEKFGTTRMDALCALWNGGRSAALLKGNFNPDEWIYTERTHKTLEKYKVIEK